MGLRGSLGECKPAFSRGDSEYSGSRIIFVRRCAVAREYACLFASVLHTQGSRTRPGLEAFAREYRAFGKDPKDYRILLSDAPNLHILCAIPIELDPMNLQLNSLLCPLFLSQSKELSVYVSLL